MPRCATARGVLLANYCVCGQGTIASGPGTIANYCDQPQQLLHNYCRQKTTKTNYCTPGSNYCTTIAKLLQQLLHSVLASAWLPEVNWAQRWLPQATIATPGTWVLSKWALREFDCATHTAPTLFLQGPACSIECPAAARHKA